jgi:hypothetical protein
MVIYLDDYLISFQQPVRLLQYEKGDRIRIDYASVFFPNDNQ